MNFEFIDLGIKIKDTLIFSDVHIGIEKSMHNKGFLIPLNHLRNIKDIIDSMIISSKPKRIIINGDLKHDFHTINKDEWRDAIKLLDYILSKDIDLIIIKGNHDNMLKPIIDNINIPLFESFTFDGFFVCHGNRLLSIPSDCHTIVIGHEHPALNLKDNSREERYKCFLVGNYSKDKRIIVLPSINPLSYGSDILLKKAHSPFMINASELRVYVPEGTNVVDFGLLEDISDRLYR